jgi:hypothetical protein
VRCYLLEFIFTACVSKGRMCVVTGDICWCCCFVQREGSRSDLLEFVDTAGVSMRRV